MSTREIKFRGINPDTNKWVYGSLDTWYDGSTIISYWYSKLIEPDVNYHEPAQESEQVKTETVGQYTGLKDKNGVEIYEGDIVSYSRDHSCHNYIGFVSYKPAEFFVKIISSTSFRHSSELMLINDNGVTANEIIGNIHQNPELLK